VGGVVTGGTFRGDARMVLGANSAAGAREPGGEWLTAPGTVVEGVIAVVSSTAKLYGALAPLYFASRLSRPNRSCIQ
jgi:hypothetical protein